MANFIPGINVRNAIKQVGSFAGLAPRGDYDVLDHVTNSNRPGQVQINRLPDVTSSPRVIQSGSPQQVQGAQNTGNNTGGTATRVVADPYARWGGVSGFNAAKGKLDANATGYRQGAETSLRDVGDEYTGKVNRFVNEITDSQGGINQGLARNALNLRTTMADIVRGIQTGIRSGGVALAGMNASDSGAADAMARAYAQVGNNQTSDARGEAGVQFEELQQQQGALDRTRREGIDEQGRWTGTETDRVRNDFNSKLDSLAAMAAAEGIGGYGDKGVVSQVVDAALSRLAEINQSRDSRLAGVRQWSGDEVTKEALRLEGLGQTGDAFSVEGPNVNYGGAQPLAGAPQAQLPIYTKSRDELATIPTKDDDKK